MMASPQLENGYLRIANELAEAFARVNLSAYEWRALWVVIRKTYGWRKKTDRISYRQFAKCADIDLRNAFRAVQSLVGRNILTQQKDSNTFEYGLQKDYSQWEESATSPEKKSASLPENVVSPDNVVSSDNSDVVPTDNGDVVPTDDNKKHSVKTSKNTVATTLNIPYQAATYLRNRIAEFNPRTPVPDETGDGLKKWAGEMERLHRLGPLGAKASDNKGYSWTEIRELIVSAQIM